MVWVDDGLHFGDEVGDVLEGRVATHEAVEDAAEGPHVTLHANLQHVNCVSPYAVAVTKVTSRHQTTLIDGLPKSYRNLACGFMQNQIIASHTCFGGHMDVKC